MEKTNQSLNHSINQVIANPELLNHKGELKMLYRVCITYSPNSVFYVSKNGFTREKSEAVQYPRDLAETTANALNYLDKEYAGSVEDIASFEEV